MLPQDGPAQVKQDVVEALLLGALGGQLQDLGVAMEELAGVAGCSRRLHLVAGQHPHLHAGLVERLNSVRCFFLEPFVERRQRKQFQLNKIFLREAYNIIVCLSLYRISGLAMPSGLGPSQ